MSSSSGIIDKVMKTIRGEVPIPKSSSLAGSTDMNILRDVDDLVGSTT